MASIAANSLRRKELPVRSRKFRSPVVAVSGRSLVYDTMLTRRFSGRRILWQRARLLTWGYVEVLVAVHGSNQHSD